MSKFLVGLLIGLVWGVLSHHFYISGKIENALDDARAAIHSATKPDTLIEQLQKRLE
jgi:hypothetical protein